MTTKSIFGLSICALLLFGCQNSTAPTALPTPKIAGIQPKATNVPLFKEFVAQVYGHKDIPIRARVDGYLEGLHFREGFAVQKGQLLYSIDPQPFQQEVNNAQSALAEAEVQSINAKNDLQRIEPLAAIDAVSQRDLDAAKAHFEASQAKVSAAKAKLELAKINLGYTRISAPISGLIGKTQAKVGEYVGREPNPVILNTVSLLDTVYVEFFLNENDYLQLAKVREELQASSSSKNAAPLSLTLSDGSTFPHPGKLRFVDRGVDPATGSILLQAAFPNPEGLLRPGQFARVKAFIGQAQNVYLIPQPAVSELQGKYTIWVAGADRLCKKVFVEVLGTYEGQYIVKANLATDEYVLVEAVQRLKADLEIEVTPPTAAASTQGS